MEIMKIKTITAICIVFHGIYLANGVIDAPGGVIYDSTKSEDFKFGLAVPGESCLTDAEQKTAWSKLGQMKSEKEKEQALMTLVWRICGKFRGFHCVNETKRCDCMGSQYTWEPNHDGSYGCRILANQACGVDNPETGEKHGCVHGSSCGAGGGPAPPPPAGTTPAGAMPPAATATVLADESVTHENGNDAPTQSHSNNSRQGGNTCVCQYPGFRNCTEIKMIPHSFHEENGVSPLRIRPMSMASFMFIFRVFFN